MDAELEFAIKYRRANARKRAAAADALIASKELESASKELNEITEDAHFSKKLKAAEEDVDFNRKLNTANHYTVICAAWALTNGKPVDYDWQVDESAECGSCNDDVAHGYYSKLYTDKWQNETTYCSSCRADLDGYNTFAELVEALLVDEDDRDEDAWIPLGPQVGKLTCSVCKKAPPTKWLLFSEELRCDACPLAVPFE
jgi:predicted DNA binding protein